MSLTIGVRERMGTSTGNNPNADAEKQGSVLFLFARQFPVHHFKKGSYLAHQGDENASAFFIEGGAAMSECLTPSGECFGVTMTLEGELASDSLTTNRRTYGLQATLNTASRKVPVARILEELEKSPALAQALFENSSKIQERERVLGIACRSKNANAMLATFLRLYAQETNDQRIRVPNYGGRLISGMTGLTQETISRASVAFQNRGLIAKRNGGFEILKPEALESISAGERL